MPPSPISKRTFFYFHGFNSAPGTDKAQALRDAFPAATVREPTIPYHRGGWFAGLEARVREEALSGPSVLAGTSLGGFVALQLARRLDLKALVANPVVWARHMMQFVGPQTNFATGFQYEWTAGHVNDLEALETAEPAAVLRPGQAVAALGHRDDLIDLPRTESRFRESRQTVWWFDDDHRFSAGFRAALTAFRPFLAGD